ncbi:MAG: ABC transporter permease subunit [Bdellovibrionales bacterium]|nr:ABC transporter permease subunit [Bdellovibrionales bacterium]
MRSTLLIAWKDFKQIILSPSFFLVAAFCAIIWSITYKGFISNFAGEMMASNMQGRPAPNIIRVVFTQHIQVTNLLFIFIVPALTMRLISEEKKSRTYDLLLTSPITATNIVIGKFMAGIAAAATLLAISFLYPAAMGFVADFSWTTLLSLYLGIFFITALYTGAGMFASSLTESPMLAFIMGVIFNFLIWFIGPSTSGTEIKWLASVMEYLTVGTQMMGFVNGAIQISAVIFFITAISFFVFLSQRVVESSRWR